LKEVGQCGQTVIKAGNGDTDQVSEEDSGVKKPEYKAIAEEDI
jgi:hypothetical protein